MPFSEGSEGPALQQEAGAMAQVPAELRALKKGDDRTGPQLPFAFVWAMALVPQHSQPYFRACFLEPIRGRGQHRPRGARAMPGASREWPRGPGGPTSSPFQTALIWAAMLA